MTPPDFAAMTECTCLCSVTATSCSVYIADRKCPIHGDSPTLCTAALEASND